MCTPASSLELTARCEALRWPSGPHCPRCRSTRIARRANPAHPFACHACRHRFSLTSGTVLHASPITLATWLRAFDLFFAQAKPLLGTELRRQLDDAVGINTARRMVRILRSLAPYAGGNPDQALRLALSTYSSRRTTMSSPLIPTDSPAATSQSFVAKAVTLLDAALDDLSPTSRDWSDRTVFLNRLSRSLRDVGHFVTAAPHLPPPPIATASYPTPAYWPTETVEEWNARQLREAAAESALSGPPAADVPAAA